MSGAVRRALLLLAAAGCARVAPPPGGPPDASPPVLLATRPDSLIADPAWRGAVEFIFDETISEGNAPNFGLGTGDLERLLLLSPTRQVPVVRWKRNRITVHPREGWQPGTVYRVELLSGVVDLRNNRSRATSVVTFSTGADIPRDTLSGLVVDWQTSRPAGLAVIEAFLLPDSLIYRTLADSAGRFAFGPLPAGEYMVRGVVDQNRNGRLDLREAFDTVHVTTGRDSVGEIWAFAHDTLPPRPTQASLLDSLSMSVDFSQSLDPYQRLPVDSVVIRRASDSTLVTVLAALPRAAYDSAFPPVPPAPVDSAARDSLVDSTGRAPPAVPPPRVAIDTMGRRPLTTKPPLTQRLIIRVEEALVPGERYLVDLSGVRNVTGTAGRGRVVLSVAAAPVRTPPDSTGRPDTAAVRRPLPAGNRRQ